ncbi:ABC transporter permease [Mobilicoccus pelagius]|uniref:Putative ABC transporter permease protein n=1 Tax=Mobilicoccus pelagius NBRC 104925 TaxID=1089455 RepID=H5UW45_9MICO|nr:ABC transporter permease [Mobilicoccus pelagius]GAB49953.1 putative ABC transporter permease protein [Mobilicoccus pelagius NBRC 104925]
MTWLPDNLGTVAHLAGAHTVLAGVPLLVGLALALPLGWLAHSRERWRPVLVAGTGLLYTIPSLALFVLMPILLGTRILDPVNVVVAMTLYTIALLVRTVADGLDSVPEHVTAAATAMGYGGLARTLRIDLPLAVPVIAAGLRVAAVSNVSIVSVASLIGVQQLGVLLTDGYGRNFPEELWVGIVSCLLLALAFDLVVVVTARLLTPWTRAGGVR